MSLREQTIERLNKLIENYSQFNQEDKIFWKEQVENLPPEYIFFLIDLFENSPEDILFLNQNLKEKMQILDTLDTKNWHNLLKKEEDLLENLIKKENNNQ